uniref:Putative ovule protein n=1 Tax=Solanum chacoense TaxID=4108 RepID=A0A0V0HEW8_SOLCH
MRKHDIHFILKIDHFDLVAANLESFKKNLSSCTFFVTMKCCSIRFDHNYLSYSLCDFFYLY